jgi:hypothetical protein
VTLVWLMHQRLVKPFKRYSYEKEISTFWCGMVLFSGCFGPGPPGYDRLDGHDGLVESVNSKLGCASAWRNRWYILLPSIESKDFCFWCNTTRANGTINATTPVWRLIKFCLCKGELDYDFWFCKEGFFTIYAGGNYDLSTTLSYHT